MNNPGSAARALEARVWESLGRNDARQAVAQCEALNLRYPEFASGWHTASQLALQLKNPAMALAAIEKALSIEPDSTAWSLQKGLCLAKLGDMQKLQSQVDSLAPESLKTAYQHSTYAILLTHLEQRAEAVNHYEKAAALKPDESKHYYNIACLQRSLGEIDVAERNFDKTVELDPTDYEAYKIRSELRRQTRDRNHVEELERLLQQGIDDERGRVHICYALAKELEDMGEAERSFQYLKQGADLRRSYMRYDVNRDLETIAAIQEVFDSARCNKAIHADSNAEAIFILGMPRTGTTLVERILSSHTDVYAAGELNNFAVQMMKLVKARAGNRDMARDELVRRSAELDYKKLGEAYIDSTRPFTGHTPRFIDKLPLNYLYAGLIHLALPNARIINLRRHPLDTCYAIYKQLFVDAYPFSYDLRELGQYYAAYHRLMEHWQSVLPGAVHVVEYEKLVTDLEGEARRLLKFCNLDWQLQILKFHESKDASTTASSVQVRQPVYQSSVGRWQQYRQQLAPLIEVLEAAEIPLHE